MWVCCFLDHNKSFGNVLYINCETLWWGENYSADIQLSPKFSVEKSYMIFNIFGSFLAKIKLCVLVNYFLHLNCNNSFKNSQCMKLLLWLNRKAERDMKYQDLRAQYGWWYLFILCYQCLKCRWMVMDGVQALISIKCYRPATFNVI